MSRLASAIVALAAAALTAATAAEAMPVNAAANARIQANADLAGGQNNLATQVSSTTPGFSHGRKVGWRPPSPARMERGSQSWMASRLDASWATTVVRKREMMK